LAPVEPSVVDCAKTAPLTTMVPATARATVVERKVSLRMMMNFQIADGCHSKAERRETLSCLTGQCRLPSAGVGFAFHREAQSAFQVTVAQLSPGVR
jgi:hypothetical protein